MHFGTVELVQVVIWVIMYATHMIFSSGHQNHEKTVVSSYLPCRVVANLTLEMILIHVKGPFSVAVFPTSVQDSSEYNELPVRHNEDNMNR